TVIAWSRAYLSALANPLQPALLVIVQNRAQRWLVHLIQHVAQPLVVPATLCELRAIGFPHVPIRVLPTLRPISPSLLRWRASIAIRFRSIVRVTDPKNQSPAGWGSQGSNR